MGESSVDHSVLLINCRFCKPSSVSSSSVSFPPIASSIFRSVAFNFDPFFFCGGCGVGGGGGGSEEGDVTVSCTYLQS